MPVDALLARSRVRSAHQMGQRCCRDRLSAANMHPQCLVLVVDGIFDCALRRRSRLKKIGTNPEVANCRMREYHPAGFRLQGRQSVGTAGEPSETVTVLLRPRSFTREKHFLATCRRRDTLSEASSQARVGAVRPGFGLARIGAPPYRLREDTRCVICRVRSVS